MKRKRTIINKKIASCILSLFFFLIFSSNTFASGPSYVSNEVIVKFKQGQSIEDLQQLVQARKNGSTVFIIGGIEKVVGDLYQVLTGEKQPEEKLLELQKVQKDIGFIKSQKIFNIEDVKSKKIGLDYIKLIKTDGRLSVDKLIEKYRSLSEIEYAEKNGKLQARFTPNDTYYGQMWSLSKIAMANAWDLQGSNLVTVAVVDSGIDYNHTDLPSNIIKGPNYIAGNNDPMDDFGHGTHVAGIIGAITNNAKGISGINQNINLMAVKVLNSSGTGSVTDVASGITYAALNGAKVINLSLGGAGQCPQSFQDAIDYAYQQGGVVVGAIGEGSPPLDVDTNPDTPTSCNHIISVSATGPNDERAVYSYYGTTVDVAAPGGDDAICGNQITCLIISTFPNDQYALWEGTSMATPHVAGLASLILSKDPGLSPDQVKAIIKNNADTITTDYPIGKRINAYQALLSMSLDTPSPTDTPIVIDTLTPSPTDTPIVTDTLTPSPTDTPTDTPIVTDTLTPSPTDTPIVTNTLTPSPTDTPTDTPIVTDTLTPSSTDTPTDTPIVTDTLTPSPTDTPTDTPIVTDTLTPTLSPTSASNSVINSSNSSGSSSNNSGCSSQPPSHAPDLFQVDVQSTTATLHFAPAGDPVNYYYIGYGINEAAENYGVQFNQGSTSGAITYIINFLSPNTVYYFKVRGGNDCKTGDWSNVRQAKTLNNTAQGKSSSLNSGLAGNVLPATGNNLLKIAGFFGLAVAFAGLIL